MKKIITTFAPLAAATAWAQNTPVSLWKTIDDDGRTEKSLLRIVEQGDALIGRIEKLYEADKQDAKCDKCSDERKDKPMLGMTIIRNARPDGDKQHWEGGDILDPNNGKVYKLRLKPLDGGRKLEVHGYIGPFLRNQHWTCVE